MNKSICSDKAVNDNLLRSIWTGVLRGEMNGEAGGDWGRDWRGEIGWGCSHSYIKLMNMHRKC